MLEIDTKIDGAELVSIKLNGIEKLHDGLKDWNRHSPVLFPIVGKLKDGKTIIENKVFEMGQHGFARDMKFEKVGKSSYKLKYNEETLKKFPYKFELYVAYEVVENSLITKYVVKNIDDKIIKFGLGGHPAYKCDYKNCVLEFDKNEEEIKFFQLENGLLKNKEEETLKFINDNKIKLNENIFENDAIIMKNLKSNKVILKSNNEKILEFEFVNFPYLAIWSKPNAEFLCIEPWFNTADKIDSDGKFDSKENLISLEPEQIFKCSYTVTFF